jgi:DNA-binding transcriptional regulator PaaX
MDSSSLFQNLTTKAGADRFEIHAVRMALVRYYRQGLLKRIRSGGQFKYTLSGRGVSRLKWLEETKDSGAR